jgi:hypothetical protein
MNRRNQYHDQQYVILRQFFVINANVRINHVNVQKLEVLMYVLYIVQFLSIMLIEQFLILLNQMDQRLKNRNKLNNLQEIFLFFIHLAKIEEPLK